MRKVRTLKGLQIILLARRMARSEAAQELSDLRREEDAKNAQLEMAEQSLRKSTDAWQRCLSAGVFDPQALSFFSAKLTERHAELEASKSAHTNAQRRTELARSCYASREMQVSQTDIAMQRVRKKILRLVDEKRLSEMEDRVSYQWVKP